MFPAQYYYPVYIHIALFMVVLSWMWLYNSDSTRIITEKRDELNGWIVAILFTVIVGLRPISWQYFGDTGNYAIGYYALQANIGNSILLTTDGDWLFYLLMSACSHVMDVEWFFLIVEVFYIIPIVIACKRWFPNNLTLALLFCFTAFSFFTYGVNGIRNGMACSLVILALSYINGENRDKVIAAVLTLAAISIHKSVVLPALMMFISLYYRNTRVIIGVWIFSIFISLTVGGFIESIFAGLGFDDRLAGYITNEDSNEQFSNTGFRFDFLLYSMMPIVLGYYTVIKRELQDENYLLLLHTYILSNAFWVMLIRASFSNRFAYLSWFLYPLVLAYPLLKLHVWEETQGRKCAYILFGHVAFTYLMWLI
ncbi:MAG: EpsG family protein [Rikenellaceae bacterium]